MKNGMGQYRMWCMMLGLALTGCAANEIPPDVQQAMSDARTHFEVVESLEVQNDFPADYQEARAKLVEAQNYLENKSHKERAKAPAQQSLHASQRILREFYKSTITPLARKAKEEIEKITTADPANPLKDFLPKLDELLAYSEQVENDVQVIALNRVIEDLNEVINIKHNADQNVNTTLESDVSFDTGKYELSEKGRLLLKEFFEGMIAKQQEYLQNYAGASVTIKITVIGHTDQQGFKKGTDLVKTLLAGVEDQYPQEAITQRQFLNQRLSSLRATTIGEYIQQVIQQADARVTVEQEILGQGEAVPSGMTVSYQESEPLSDPQRRICKIYSYIIVN